jgi:hypothetical protein
MEQTEKVIQTRLLEIQALEESGDALIALSDYVQRKIEEDRDRGRYVLPEELEDYLTDFFEREFRGCEVNYNTPVPGCLRIRLTPEAQGSLSEFIRDDRSLSARPLRQRDFSISFRRDVLQTLPAGLRRAVHFINHMSPLIRWITSINRTRAHGFFDVSALRTAHHDLPPGDYCYRIERWKLKGLSSKERLAYGISSLSAETKGPVGQSESIVQHLLRNARDWDYVDCSMDILLQSHTALETELTERFSAEATDFDAENVTAHQIKVQRVKSVFARRIAQDEQRLQSMRLAERDPRVIQLTEKKILKAVENRDRRLHELEQKAQIDMERAPVAAGVFRVNSEI